MKLIKLRKGTKIYDKLTNIKYLASHPLRLNIPFFKIIPLT